MTKRLADKIAIVTGGSAGIGFGASTHFAAEDAQVFITGRRRGNMDLRRSPLQATIVRLEQAQRIKPFSLDMKVLLTTEATGGAISVLMGWHKPGEGPPDHVHFDQEEVFFILEGTYELTVNGQTTTASAGTIVFIPRNVVHRFKNIGDTTACMLDWSLPGGQDHYFKAISDLGRGDGFTGKKVMAISKKFDTNFPAPQRSSDDSKR